MSLPPVAYHVRVAPDRHEIAVTLVLEGHDGAVRVETPTWVPGDYAFATFGREIIGLRAVSLRDSVELAVRRVGWQACEIETRGGAIEIAYTASCASTEFSEAAGIVGDRAGVLLGTRYLFCAAHPGPCRVTYELPDGWPLHHPSGARQIGPWTWEYPSYEVLLDTPVAFGDFVCVTRSVEGTRFHHVFLNRGAGSGSQEAAFVDELLPLAASFHRIFGSFPFTDYTYVFSLDPRDDWGLEHLTSTMIGLGSAVFTDSDQKAIGLRTCAHELFHAWNVRRLRPAPLGRLDLRNGSFTEGLWLAEGFTRYYEFLTCTRTGVYSPAQFFSSVVNYFRHLAALPAYERVSPIVASERSYCDHEKFPGRVNSAIDYYDAGMVIAFNLDSRLRFELANGTLDAAFREFYERFAGKGIGWTTADLCGFLDGLLPGLGEQVALEAGEPARLSLVDQLRRIGFDVADEEVPYLGLVLQDDTGPAIYSVLDTSPAGHSGLAAEDVVTGVDGLAFDLEALKWGIGHQSAVTLDVLRGNATQRYTIPVGRRTQIGKLTWAGTALEAQMISAWLERDFSPRPGESIPLDFYENFHGVETVI